MSLLDQGTSHHGGRGGEVLHAALQLFAKKGFAATSVREIVLAAGLTKPALYYHFGSKEGLLRTIVDEGITEMEQKVHEYIDGAADAHEALVKFLEACFELASRRPQLASLMYQIIFGSEASSAGIDVSEIARRNRELVMSVVDRAVRERLIPQESAENAGLLLSGLLNIHLMAFLKGQLQSLTPALARDAVELYLNGVASPASGTSPLSVTEG